MCFNLPLQRRDGREIRGKPKPNYLQLKSVGEGHGIEGTESLSNGVTFSEWRRFVAINV